MPYSAGTIVRIDFPSHPWHGKTVEVVADESEFEISPPDADERIFARVVFCRGDVRDPNRFPCLAHCWHGRDSAAPPMGL